MNQGHEHGMMMMSPPPSSSSSSSSSSMEYHVHNTTTSMSMPMHMMHMTFYWGKRAQILFSGWPGADGLKYALSLLLVFLLAFGVECLSRVRFIKPGAGGHSNNDVVSGLFLTQLHALRMGLAYLVMLAVMSFNAGVFIAAIVGHAFGFLVFGTRIFRSGRIRSDDPDLPPYERATDLHLPPMSC